MAAEDWIDWSDYLDAEYWVQFQDETKVSPYTDKFTFNGRRLRTKRQLMMQRESYMPQYTDMMKLRARTESELKDLLGEEIVVQVEREKFPVITKDQATNNKFYISSPSVFINNWGHPTLEEAIKHAQDMLQKRKDINDVAIVEVVRIVRRKPIEVDIENV